jgi:hypothetical protein
VKDLADKMGFKNVVTQNHEIGNMLIQTAPAVGVLGMLAILTIGLFVRGSH